MGLNSNEFYKVQVKVVGLKQSKKEHFEMQIIDSEKSFKVQTMNIDEIASMLEFDPMELVEDMEKKDKKKNKQEESEKIQEFGVVITLKEKISLKFLSKVDVLEWTTKILYLKERLQYSFFRGKFKDQIAAKTDLPKQENSLIKNMQNKLN